MSTRSVSRSRQETGSPLQCLAAYPQDHSGFGLPAETAERLWCPARDVFPAHIRVGKVITSEVDDSTPDTQKPTRLQSRDV